MTISKELYLAILSMDAYNRGYDAGISDGKNVDASGNDIDGLGEGGQIGLAVVRHPLSLGVSETDHAAWQTADFYAVAYTMGADAPEGLAGKTVISYRGKDNPGLRGGAVSGGAGLLRHLHPLHSPASFVT